MQETSNNAVIDGYELQEKDAGNLERNDNANMTLSSLQGIIESFRRDRGWDASDTPYILAKSVFVEAAELLECYQNGEHDVDESAIKSEVADVLMYTLSLCYDVGWNPADVILEKMNDVARRYPKVNQ